MKLFCCHASAIAITASLGIGGLDHVDRPAAVFLDEPDAAAAATALNSLQRQTLKLDSAEVLKVQVGSGDWLVDRFLGTQPESDASDKAIKVAEMLSDASQSGASEDTLGMIVIIGGLGVAIALGAESSGA